MIKKIVKVIFLTIITVIFLIVIFRNPILKFYIETYVDKNLKAQCKIEKVNSGIDFLSAEGIVIKTADYDVDAGGAVLEFVFQKERPFVSLAGIKLSGITVKIKSLKNTDSIIKGKGATGAFDIFAGPVEVSLNDVNISLRDKALQMDSRFSAAAEISKEKIFIKDARIASLNLNSQDFEITGLNLKKFGKNKYLIKILDVRIKDERFADFCIPVKVNVNQFLFPKARSPFFGSGGSLSAKCDFYGYDNVCCKAKFFDISFEKIVDIFASEEAAFKGSFDGYLKICADLSGITDIQADFANKGNGFINIKKESSFAFLKSYLDIPSYNALIDNFKNYEYNIGVVNAKKEGKMLNLRLDFISDAMGRRNVTVNFHDVLGGKK